MSTIFRVERTGNFTVMSNMHLKDRRLSFKSKGLLSVIFSLPPDWKYTLTGFAKIAADGVESVKSTVKELEKYGYVSRRQTRDERGRMSVNEYLVYENPRDNPDYDPDEDFANAFVGGVSADKGDVETVEKPVENSEKSCAKKAKSEDFSRKPLADKPLSEKPSTVNRGAVSINKLNKNLLNTEKSNHSNHARKRADRIDLIGNSQTNACYSSLEEWEEMHDRISENIEFESRYARDISVSGDVEEMVTLMTDVICSCSPTVRVNGCEMPREIVKSRYLKLNGEDIDYVLRALQHNAGDIGNIRSYLITTLFNSHTTVGNYYSALAYSDIRAGRV
ncbi:MAG: helix-turn-helix domain-containing protein [Ruminococcus sp.]|nr:helix-turn-helix domain-containing protein [Ruminococcus sp.]